MRRVKRALEAAFQHQASLGVKEGTTVERQLKSYLKRQARALILERSHDPDGFLAYFADHEPKDAEILGLLAIGMTLSAEPPLSNVFPTTLEALAALSAAGRAEICHDFRKQLKTCLDQAGTA